MNETGLLFNKGGCAGRWRKKSSHKMKTDDKVYVSNNTPTEKSKTHAEVCLPPCLSLARSARTLTSPPPPPVHPNLAWTCQESVQTTMKQVLHNDASTWKRRKNNWGTNDSPPTPHAPFRNCQSICGVGQRPCSGLLSSPWQPIWPFSMANAMQKKKNNIIRSTSGINLVPTVRQV